VNSSMNRLPRIGTLVVFGGLVAACSQLIGLDKFDDEEQASGGESGDPGTGGKAGKGGGSGAGGSVVAGSGNPTGGQAGSSATAGKGGGGGKGGSTGGDGGAAGAEGGTGALGGDGGSGGDGAAGGVGGTTGGAGGTTGGTAGQGGTAGSGVSGAGGVAGCSETIEIAATGEVTIRLETSFAGYTYNVSPQLATCSGCQGPLPDYLWVDFFTGGEYTGDQTGSFALGVGEEENYASCSRCVWLGVEFAAPDSEAYFFAKSGTMVVDSASYQMIGYPNVTLTDVTLEEVTVDFNTGLSTPVGGGRCLHLANATVYVEPVPPPEWDCPDSYYFDSDCDCGCGLVDTACYSSLVGACDACPFEGCAADSYCHEVDLDDNAVCSGPQAWTCTPVYYGDGGCDCGCGIVDIDCADASVGSCEYCDDPASCTAGAVDDCSLINPTDNSQCL
jgi:hypothetical protein